MTDSFDALAYRRVPQLNAAMTLALARRLIVEMPAAVASNELTSVAADRMHERATTLRGERLKTLNERQTVDTRPFDQGEDDAWGALQGRLASYADIDSPEGRRAADLVDRIFPDGLGFLSLRFAEQWETSDLILDLIKRENFGPEIDKLCGSPVFLAQVRTAHQLYGDALGLTKAKPATTEPPEIAQALQALRAAIRFYSRRVVALADEEQDAASVSLVQKALVPLLEAQHEARLRRAKGEPDPEPNDEGEIPPLPSS